MDLPDRFVRDTIAREGAAGRAWLAGLPDLVDGLLDRWGLSLGDGVWHGYAGVVFPVQRRGTPYALKIGWVDESSRQEALAMRAWDGRGAALLAESDADVGALLLEWLDPDTDLNSVGIDEACVVAAGLLRRLAIPAPTELRSVASESAELGAELRRRWESVGRPFDSALLAGATDICTSGTPDADLRIVNRDLHFENVLAASREPWLAIDPKPLAGPLEYGVAQLLWNRLHELARRSDLDRRLAIVSEVAGLDLDAARRWSLVRILDYWLWALEEGLDEDPVRCAQLVAWLRAD